MLDLNYSAMVLNVKRTLENDHRSPYSCEWENGFFFEFLVTPTTI